MKCLNIYLSVSKTMDTARVMRTVDIIRSYGHKVSMWNRGENYTRRKLEEADICLILSDRKSSQASYAWTVGKGQMSEYEYCDSSGIPSYLLTFGYYDGYGMVRRITGRTLFPNRDSDWNVWGDFQVCDSGIYLPRFLIKREQVSPDSNKLLLLVGQ